LLRQERDLLRFAGTHGIPVPKVIAYFDPPDGPEVLVLGQINVDGTLPSDTEIGETVRRLHGLSPPTLYTVAQGTQLPSSPVSELTVRRLNVIERIIGIFTVMSTRPSEAVVAGRRLRLRISVQVQDHRVDALVQR
jgi:hypothetical protein